MLSDVEIQASVACCASVLSHLFDLESVEPYELRTAIPTENDHGRSLVGPPKRCYNSQVGYEQTNELTIQLYPELMSV
jgi:hypothetical protein